MIGNLVWACILPERMDAKTAGNTLSLDQRASFLYLSCSRSSPLSLIKRLNFEPQTTPTNVHGHNAYAMGRALASISTALAGVNL